MTTLAILTPKSTNKDPERIIYTLEGGATPLIKATMKFKSGRTQTKTFPGINIESTVIDELIKHDSYAFTELSDEIKRCRISWATQPATEEDLQWMVQLLKALGANDIKADPLVSDQFTIFGLEFNLSVFSKPEDAELSVAFWSNKLTDEQAACLRCFSRIKPRMVDETGEVLDPNSTFASMIKSMARRADLGDEIDAALETLGASYRPVDFSILARNAGALSVDF